MAISRSTLLVGIRNVVITVLFTAVVVWGVWYACSIPPAAGTIRSHDSGVAKVTVPPPLNFGAAPDFSHIQGINERELDRRLHATVQDEVNERVTIQLEPIRVGRQETDGNATQVASNALRATITFINQTGEPALVRLIGPTPQTVDVQNGASATVNASGGQYHFLVRYGAPGSFRYAKGEGVFVTDTGNQYSQTSITLQKVLGGNYSIQPISEREFNRGM